jgi:hypothetical protein
LCCALTAGGSKLPASEGAKAISSWLGAETSVEKTFYQPSEVGFFSLAGRHSASGKPTAARGF